MGIKNEVEEVREQVEEMSFAMEMLEFSKEQAERNNKILEKTIRRLVIIIILLLVSNVATIGGFYYYITNYGILDTTETSQEVDNIDAVENSYIINGGDYNGEYKTDKKGN